MVLLAVIYLAFIALGFPDSLLGAAWPMMRVDIAAPLSMAGAVSMVCSAGTICSSLMSSRVVNRFGTGKVTALSTALTAVAMIGYALAPAPWVLFVAAVPLGLGAGAVDAALNNYVALHYEAKHMSWLHCCWGVGCSIGPMILAGCIAGGLGWRMGYAIVIGLQFLLVAVMAATQKLWKTENASPIAHEAAEQHFLTNGQALRLPGMKAVLFTFLCYCAAESSMILWTASYAEFLGASKDQASFASSLFFIGITVGRGLNGFLAMRFTSKQLIRAGIALMLTGIAVLLLPLGYAGCLAGVLIIGLGCAPIYPCTIHETPHRFGASSSQAATGLQMSFAYTGSTFMPPLMGLLTNVTGMGILPLWMLGLTGIMLVCNEMVNKRTIQREN